MQLEQRVVNRINLVCPDRTCHPEKGDDGCMAAIVNAGAFDALDFVWTRCWDDCPLIGRREYDGYEDEQYYDWIDYLIDAAEWESGGCN